MFCKAEEKDWQVINEDLKYALVASGQIARYDDTERHYQVDTTLSQEEALVLIKEEGDTFNFLDLPEKEWLRCIRLPQMIKSTTLVITLEVTLRQERV